MRARVTTGLVAVVLLGPLFLIFAGTRRFRTSGLAAALAGGDR